MDKILDGYKTIEIRGAPIKKHVGKRIWLAASGSSAISGSAHFVECLGPLSAREWHTLRPLHCIGDDDRLYGDSTYAYVLCDPKRVAEKPFVRKRGAIIWQELAESDLL